jgi:outer membrane protein W
MKKLILLVSILVSQLTFSQSNFSKGDQFVSVSYGLGTIGVNWTDLYSSYSNYSSTTLGPIGVYYEKAITDKIGIGKIGIGGSINYLRNSTKYEFASISNSVSISQMALVVRGTYHFDIKNDKFDPYTGVGLMFSHFSYKSSLTNQNFSFGSPVGTQFFVGSRYYFTNNLAAFAELGYGLSYLKLGGTFKF